MPSFSFWLFIGVVVLWLICLVRPPKCLLRWEKKHFPLVHRKINEFFGYEEYDNEN